MTVVIHAPASGLHDRAILSEPSLQHISAWDASARDTLQKRTPGTHSRNGLPATLLLAVARGVGAPAMFAILTVPPAPGVGRALVGSPADSGSARKPLHPVTTH